MIHQFKPGDLALTLVSIPGHIDAGACVEIVKKIEKGDRVRKRGILCEATQPGLIVSRDGAHYLYKPHQLMPLRGDFAPEQQKAMEADPCA